MAEKKIIGRDAMGNPIYEKTTSTNSTSSNTRGQAGGRTYGGATSTPRLANQSSRNLQGASQNTARKIVGLGDAPTLPTQDELNQVENTGVGKGGKAGNPYANMLNALQRLSKMSQNTINSGSDQLMEALSNQVNPFANFQAQNTETPDSLSSLLQSQGVSADPFQQYVSAINTQNTGQSDAFNNLAGVLSGLQTQNQEGIVGDVGQQRTNALNTLQSNIFGTGAALMGRKNIDRNAIVKMLLASLTGKA